MEQLIEVVVGQFGSLSVNVQFVILVILALVTLCAHIAPYTATKRDDFLITGKNRLWELTKRLFALVAGNYRAAKNHTKVMEDKLELKNK